MKRKYIKVFRNSIGTAILGQSYKVINKTRKLFKEVEGHDLHKLYTRGLASWSVWAKSQKTIFENHKYGTQPRLLIYILSVVALAGQQQSEAMTSDHMILKACRI